MSTSNKSSHLEIYSEFLDDELIESELLSKKAVSSRPNFESPFLEDLSAAVFEESTLDESNENSERKVESFEETDWESESLEDSGIESDDLYEDIENESRIENDFSYFNFEAVEDEIEETGEIGIESEGLHNDETQYELNDDEGELWKVSDREDELGIETDGLYDDEIQNELDDYEDELWDESDQEDESSLAGEGFHDDDDTQDESGVETEGLYDDETQSGLEEYEDALWNESDQEFESYPNRAYFKNETYLEEETLSASQLNSAIEYNRVKMKTLGWQKHFDEIVSNILKLNYSPDEGEFAQKVADWQDSKGLTPDGKIGPGTWKKMKPILGIGSSKSTTKPPSSTRAKDLISFKMPVSVGSKYIVNASSRAYGIAEAIEAIEWIGNQWHKSNPDIVLKIRDISKKGGGPLRNGTKNGKPSYHKSHQIGLDADLQLLKNGAKINTLAGKSYTLEKQNILRNFIKVILSNPILGIKIIGCTDSVLAKEFKKVSAWSGHNKHLHVRFCVLEKYRSILKKVSVPSISNYQCKDSQGEIGESPHVLNDGAHMEEEQLSASKLNSAIEYNRVKMKTLGWQKHYDDIVSQILKLNYSPDEGAFAQTVADWQDGKGLTPDGKIGTNTWNKMKAILGIGTSKSKPASSSSKVSYKKMDWNTSEEDSLFENFLNNFHSTRFSDASDINFFFKKTTGYEFCQWFREKIGNSGFFGSMPYDPTYTGKKGRTPKNIPKGQEPNFIKVFDNIPLLFNGSQYSKTKINLFQFFALTSIIINEHAGKFTVGTELGNLPYLYRYNSKANGNQGIAYNLLHNPVFLAAHGHKGNVPAKPYSNKWKLKGKSNYPLAHPKSVSSGGIIAEMDFCKFRGRGLTQITFRGTYKWLINHIINSGYSSSNLLVKGFKSKYKEKGLDEIATRSSNKEWDDLFLKTDYEIACLATYIFQKNKRNFLDLGLGKTLLKKESTKSSGTGSLFYVGYRQGGTRHYGRVVKKRVMQLMEGLLNSY